jgi:hypothetical protein
MLISREIREIMAYRTCCSCQMLTFLLEQEACAPLSHPIQQMEQLL